VSGGGPAGGGGDLRYTRSLTPSDVGARVVVRHRLEGGGLTDALGLLERWEDGVLVVRDRRGARHEVAEDAVVAAKRVPPPPERRGGRSS
jgi:hypothetical protein